MSSGIDALNRLSAEWATLVAAAIWQSTLWALIIAVIAYALRAASPVVRYWLWQIVAIKLVLTFMGSWSLSLAWLPAPGATVDDTSPALVELVVDPLAEMPSGALANPRGARRPDWRLGDMGWQSWLLLGWGAAITWQLAQIVVQRYRLSRLLRQAAPAADDLIAAVASVCERLGLRRPPLVVLTRENCSPFVCRILRPTLVVNQHLLTTLEPAELRQVLAHELAHVKRRDLLWGWTAEIARLLYFFHPVAHWANYRIRLERELACDQLAMAISGRRPAEYADTLVRIVSSISSPSIFRTSAAAGLDGNAPLETRPGAGQTMPPQAE